MVGNPAAFSIPCGTDLEWRRIQRVLHMVAHKHRFLCVFDFCVSMVYDLFVYHCRHELQIRSSEKDEQTICCGADKKISYSVLILKMLLFIWTNKFLFVGKVQKVQNRYWWNKNEQWTKLKILKYANEENIKKNPAEKQYPFTRMPE